MHKSRLANILASPSEDAICAESAWALLLVRHSRKLPSLLQPTLSEVSRLTEAAANPASSLQKQLSCDAGISGRGEAEFSAIVSAKMRWAFIAHAKGGLKD